MRRLLREGEIDPFDLVAKEGSSLRRELVDVDEIFATGPAEAFAKNQPTQPKGEPQWNAVDPPSMDAERARLLPNTGKPVRLGAGSESQPVRERARAEDTAKANRGHPKLGANAGAAIGKSTPWRWAQLGRGLHAKQFFLTDKKGRYQGPLSGQDILGLYSRGVLSPDVLVMRRKSNAQIPVERFVATLGHQPKPQGAPKAAARPVIVVPQIPPEVLLRIRRQMGQYPSTAVAAVAAGLILIVLAFALVLSSRQPARTPLQGKQSSNTSQPLPSPRKAPPLKASTRETNHGPKPAKQGPSPKKAPAKAASTLQSPARKSKDSPRPAKTAFSSGSLARGKRVPPPSPATKRTPTNSGARPAKLAPSPALNGGKLLLPAKKVPAAQQALLRPALRSPIAANPKPSLLPPAPSAGSPSAPVSLSSRPQPSRPSRPPSPSVSSKVLVDGATVQAIGPYSFNKKQIEACSGACKIDFTGPGGRVTGVFFRNVWGPLLLERNGPVRVSGLVRQTPGGFKILISDIQ